MSQSPNRGDRRHFISFQEQKDFIGLKKMTMKKNIFEKNIFCFVNSKIMEVSNTLNKAVHAICNYLLNETVTSKKRCSSH